MESELLRIQWKLTIGDFTTSQDYAIGTEGVEGPWKERGHYGLYWDIAFQPKSIPKELLLGFSLRLLGREGDSWCRWFSSDCCPERTRSTGTIGNRVGHLCSNGTGVQGHLEDDWLVWGTICGV